jgi:PAS domain S-box-containing protein
MKTAFIGGGPGCKALIEMIVSKRFQSFSIEMVAVADTNPASVGYAYAESLGIPVFTDLTGVLAIEGLEMIFELVGSDVVLEEIYQRLPQGVRVIDHVTARVYWELEESQRRFHQMFNSAHGIITIKDVNGRYLMANRRAAEFFDIEQDWFIGKTSADFLSRSVADLFEVSEKRIIQSGRHESLNEVFEYEGVERRWMTERFPIEDYLGNVVGVCSISRDVTNEERLKRELIQSVKMATLGQLAAGVAHEINNPLTGILSFAENLQLSLDPADERYGDLGIIIRETMRCRQIVRDLLDYSRLSKPEPELMSMNAVVERVLAMVSKQAAFHDVTFTHHAAREMPDVKMDPTQAQQVILNLIINAGEAMNGKGRIEISLFKDEHHKCVVMDISDTGCGIPEEKHQEIFEPFYSTKGSQGNGLGLPAVLRIVEAHNGCISVDSKVGEGTTFRIAIPYVLESEKKEVKDACDVSGIGHR